MRNPDRPTETTAGCLIAGGNHATLPAVNQEARKTAALETIRQTVERMPFADRAKINRYRYGGD